MTAPHFSLLASLIFALVAVLQIIRAVKALPVTIGSTSIPVSASWIAGSVALVLAWLGYMAAQG